MVVLSVQVVVINGSSTPNHPASIVLVAMITSLTVLPSDHHQLSSSHCSELLLHCIKCGKLVKASEYIKHCDNNCELFSHPVMNSPSKVTLHDVLSKPVSTPATPMERRVTEHLVRRLLDESPEEKVIKE